MNFKRTLKSIEEYLDIAAFFIYSMKSIFTYRHKGKTVLFESIVKQLLFSGMHALFVIILVSLLMGIIVIFTFNNFAVGESIISSVLSSAIIQYSGPIITMMIVIGRSGTAIATEIGNMRASNEVEALEVMGIDPLYYISAPRIIGMTIALLCLNIFFSLVGIIGGSGVMVNIIDGFNLDIFYRNFFKNLSLLVLIESNLKALGFGIIISTVSCYQGFQVKSSATEVPQMTTIAVGRSIVLCFLYFAYITFLFTFVGD